MTILAIYVPDGNIGHGCRTRYWRTLPDQDDTVSLRQATVLYYQVRGVVSRITLV